MLTPQDQVVLTSLEIVISLLVFGVGLPMSLSDRGKWLARTRDRYSIWAWYPTYVGLILMTIVIVLTLYFIDTPKFLGCSVQSSMQQNFLCQFITWSRHHAHTISGLLVIIASAISLSLWLRLRTYNLRYVVSEIGDIALGRSSRQRIAQWPLFHSVGVSKEEKESCIRDLGDIGGLVEFDDERQLVLETLKKLTEADHLFDARDESYSLLRAFVEAVLKAASTEDTANQKTAINIMYALLSKSIERGGYCVSIVSEYLVRLGKRTITFKNVELDLSLLDVVGSVATIHHALPLFDWGVLALGLGRKSAAISIIDRLHMQTERIMPEDASAGLQFTRSPEIAYLFVGLVAHFCTVDGGAGRTQQEEGWRRLNSTFQGFELQMDSLFDRGIRYFRLERADFTTVDRIVELRTNFNTRQP